MLSDIQPESFALRVPMPLKELQVSGYRSLRSVRLPLQQLNVVTGPNGSGKSNLYKVLWLIAQICEGEFARSLTREGGFLSALWAGPRTSTKPHRMTLGFHADDFCFEINCGFPQPSRSAFWSDAEIKEETVGFGPKRTPATTLLPRSVGTAWPRDVESDRGD